MFEVVTEILIDASTSVVWNVLTDTARYGAWNPLVVRFDGELRRGARSKITLAIEGRRTPKIAVDVEIVEPRVELAWSGGPRAILRGTHYFRLSDAGSGRTRFVHGEQFVGPLSRALPLMRKKVESGYFALNKAMKREAERRAASIEGAAPITN
jgi:hypothetical protein